MKIEDQILDIAFEVNLAHEVYISPRVIGRATLADPVWKMTRASATIQGRRLRRLARSYLD
ncbi:MAG: hypothetical protein HY726_18390 [Candidatus Rokubacteria bacterium]|nr:hypothetical protein [Candidatus Rokubacteria bacterium]